MKKLYMKEKILSNLDEFTVKDETGEDRYKVHGDFVQIGGKKLHIEDTSGRELALIKQKTFSLMPKFFVYMNEQEVAQIVKKMSFFKAKYVIDGPGWNVKGSILDHDYTITDNQGDLVHMHKAWFTWGDSYELDIEDRANEPMVLAAILAIDMVMAAQEEAAMSDHDN